MQKISDCGDKDIRRNCMPGLEHLEVKKLELIIPRKDLPLKSDVIIGYKEPVLVYHDDECSFDQLQPSAASTPENIVFLLEKFYCVDSSRNWTGKIEELCIQYKGTFIANGHTDGDDENSYYRVRDGVKKNVKVTLTETD